MNDALPPVDEHLASDWRRFPASAGWLARIAGALQGLVLALGASAFAVLLRRDDLATILPWLIAGVGAAVLFGAWFGHLRWRHAAWKLDGAGLQVKRGRFWRSEVLVPRSRVQHLDIERGPIERHFGLATLIVHTAGTRTHALRQAGFPDADAVALRDALVPASDRHDDVL